MVNQKPLHSCFRLVLTGSGGGPIFCIYPNILPTRGVACERDLGKVADIQP